MIQALIGPIASLAGTWLEGKVEKKGRTVGIRCASSFKPLRVPYPQICRPLSHHNNDAACQV